MTEQHARSILSAENSYASVRDRQPAGLAITAVRPKTDSLRHTAILMLVIGPISIVAGFLLLQHSEAIWLQGPMARSPFLLIIFGFLGSVMALALLILSAVHGPPRNVELEVWPGGLKADRSIAGDRVVSTYQAAEVRCFFVEDNMLLIETRNGPSQLIAFGNKPTNTAIAALLALHMWPETTIVETPVARLDRVVYVPAPQEMDKQTNNGDVNRYITVHVTVISAVYLFLPAPSSASGS